MATLYGLERINGVDGAPITASSVHADSADGGEYPAGATFHAVNDDETDGHLVGQIRYSKAVALTTDTQEDPRTFWVRRGITIDTTPTAATNLVELNATGTTPQGAVAHNSNGRLTVYSPSASNVSGSHVYTTGEHVDITWNLDTINGVQPVKVQAGSRHPTLPEGTVIETIAGNAPGTATVNTFRWGSMAVTAHTYSQYADDVQVSDTPIIIAEPDPDDDGPVQLQYVTQRPTQDGFVVTAKCDQGTAYRLRVKKGGVEQPNSPSPQQTPDEYGFAHLTASGLQPFTAYDSVRVEAKVGGMWVNAGNTFPSKTLPQQGAIVPVIKMVFGACQFPNKDTSEQWSYDRIEVFDPDYFILDGDDGYPNNPATSVAPHVQDYLDIMDIVPKLKKLKRDRPGWMGESDHDREGGNDLYATACIPYSQAAARVISTYPATPVAGAFAWRVPLGRAQIVKCDIRTLDRTDPFASDWDGPNGRAVSDAQLAQLKTWIEDPDFAHTIFVTDAPWHGEDAEGKGDHWCRYPYQRALIGESMAKRGPTGGIIMGHDFHGLGADDGTHNPYGGGYWPVTSNGGLRSGRGPGNRKHGIEWTEGYVPDFDTPNSVKIAVHGELTITDDGSSIGVEWVGRDNFPGAATPTPVTYSSTQTVTTAVARSLYVEAEIDGFPLTNPDLGRQQLEIKEGLRGMEYVPVDSNVDGLHGSNSTRGYYKDGLLPIPVLIRADTAAELRDRWGAFKRLCSGQRTMTMTYPDGLRVTAPCVGYKQEIVGNGDEAFHAILAMAFFTQRFFWRDTLAKFDKFEDLSNNQILTLESGRGSTAPITGAQLELRGQWLNVEIRPQDQGGEMDPPHALMYNAQPAGNSLSGPNKLLLIDTSGTGTLTAVTTGSPTPGWTPDYKAFSHPGSPYVLEIPPGSENTAPQLKVKGDFTSASHLEVYYYRYFLSL